MYANECVHAPVLHMCVWLGIYIKVREGTYTVCALGLVGLGGTHHHNIRDLRLLSLLRHRGTILTCAWVCKNVCTGSVCECVCVCVCVCEMGHHQGHRRTEQEHM